MMAMTIFMGSTPLGPALRVQGYGQSRLRALVRNLARPAMPPPRIKRRASSLRRL
jgi:hypothetical protein